MNKKTNLDEINELVAEKIMELPLTAQTDKDIAEAIMRAMTGNSLLKDGSSTISFDFNSDRHKIYELRCTDSKFDYGGVSGNDGYGLWFWHNRFHQDYQKDIETHVQRWRRTVPDYCGNIRLAWEVAEKVDFFCEYTIMYADGEWWAIQTASINPRASLPDGNLFADVNDRLEIIAMGKTPSEALCRGSLVIKGREIEQASKTNQRDHLQSSAART